MMMRTSRIHRRLIDGSRRQRWGHSNSSQHAPPSGCATLPRIAARHFSSWLDPPARDDKQNNDDESKQKKQKQMMHSLSWLAIDPSVTTTLLASSAATTGGADAAAATMNPVLQHLLETIINWGVPSSMAVAVVAGVALARRARPSSSSTTTQSSSKDQKNKKRSTNPATELYDDLYVSDKTSAEDSKSPAEEMAQLLRDLARRDGGAGGRQKRQALIRKNRGIPPQQYITLTHWNEKLDSYQYSFNSATLSKALAAAKYRQQNFARAFATALRGEPLEPHTKAQLLELERDFLQEGTQLVQTIQSKQTKLTRLSIEEEMEQMGIEPFQMDPPPKEQDEEEKEEEGENKSTGEERAKTESDGKEGKDTGDGEGNDDKDTNEKIKDDNKKDDNNKGREEEDKPAEILGISQFEAQDLKSSPSGSEKPKEGEDDNKTKTSTATTTSSTSPTDDKTTHAEHWNKLQEAQRKLMELELQFIRDLVSILGNERATAIEVALVGDVKARGMGGLLTQLQARPLASMLQMLRQANKYGRQRDEHEHDDAAGTSRLDDVPYDMTYNRPPAVFVTRFPGDTRASQVTKLREEITAIIRNAAVSDYGGGGSDQVVVILESGGGTVTGYGLAAGQLQRIKHAGLGLTVVVEQVAASGGYMMCCVGDEIIGSPFAAFGSIGVLTEIPNVHSRLKREGVEWQTVTAGDYKRTLTPFKEVTQEDYDKTKDDLESILAMFQKFVHENRPQLDINAVATGEVWFGTDAVKRGLCDRIAAADDVLMEYVDQGWDVYEVEYKKPSRLSRLRALGVTAAAEDDDYDETLEEGGGGGMLRRGIRWLVRSVASEVKSILAAESEQILTQQSKPQEQKYMAHDDRPHQIRTQSSRH